MSSPLSFESEALDSASFRDRLDAVELR
jgi:hypothetical protein